MNNNTHHEQNEETFVDYSITPMLYGANIHAKLKASVYRDGAILNDIAHRIADNQIMSTLRPYLINTEVFNTDNDVSICYTFNGSLNKALFGSALSDFAMNGQINILLFHCLYYLGYLYNVLSPEEIRFLLSNERSHCLYLANLFTMTTPDGNYILKINL